MRRTQTKATWMSAQQLNNTNWHLDQKGKKRQTKWKSSNRRWADRSGGKRRPPPCRQHVIGSIFKLIRQAEKSPQLVLQQHRRCGVLIEKIRGKSCKVSFKSEKKCFSTSRVSMKHCGGLLALLKSHSLMWWAVTEWRAVIGNMSRLIPDNRTEPET